MGFSSFLFKVTNQLLNYLRYKLQQMAGYLFWRFYVSSKLRPCNRHKVDQMTKRHWYDDSNGMNRRNFFFFLLLSQPLSTQ